MKKRNRGYRQPNEIQVEWGNDWFTHYYQYLSTLAYQLFEWHNLPDTIDPRYLEMTIHQFGYVGFYKDDQLGYIATQGAVSGEVNHYLLPTRFNATSPTYQKNFPLFHYIDEGNKTTHGEEKGVVIWNNDYHFSSMPSIRMFSEDLAEIKEVIRTNQNAQKTPYILTANDNTRHSILNLYRKLEDNAPVIITHEDVNPETISVLNTNAPYVVDKLNTQKNAVWNEIMTYFGIKNANLEKRERMIVDEVESNNEQISSSGNIMLKSRLEACKLINNLYGLDVSVSYRSEIVDEISRNVDENHIEIKDMEKGDQDE